jgi:predicted small integral membrane protein
VFEEPFDEQAERQDVPQYLSRFLTFWSGENAVPIRGKRRGFLPFDTNPFDRVFVSIILMVAIHLLWMRFLEEHITLTLATILTLILSALIFVRG